MKSALELARLFHDTYERLAPHFGYETRADTREFDPDSRNGQLMIAVCAHVQSALTERCLGDQGECAYHGACMYACGSIAEQGEGNG